MQVKVSFRKWLFWTAREIPETSEFRLLDYFGSSDWLSRVHWRETGYEIKTRATGALGSLLPTCVLGVRATARAGGLPEFLFASIGVKVALPGYCYL